MPFFTIHTNAKLRNNTTEQFLSAAADLVAKELGKPKSYVVITYDYNPQMCFGGNAEVHGVLAELKSIGFKDKADLAKILTEFLYDRLEKIELDAVNIEFIDIPAKDLAIGGSLLA